MFQSHWSMCDLYLTCLQYYFIWSSVCLKIKNRNILYWPTAIVLIIYPFLYGNGSLFHILVGQYLHKWVMAWKCPCDVSVVVTIMPILECIFVLNQPKTYSRACVGKAGPVQPWSPGAAILRRVAGLLAPTARGMHITSAVPHPWVKHSTR